MPTTTGAATRAEAPVERKGIVDAQTLIAAVCRDALEAHATDDPKRKVTLATLRKVADRALQAYQEAPYPGRAVLPWVSERVALYMQAVAGDGRDALDKDLLPMGHPARPRSALDPWAELLGAEERIQALQKSVLEAVTRSGVRKTDDTELVAMNRRLSHLFEQHFAGVTKETAPSGIDRARVVKAAALVHEELERRGLFSPEEPLPREVHKQLYEEARAVRAEPEVLVYEGELRQHATGVELQLGRADILIKHADAPLCVSRKNLAARFSPAGSLVHVPFLEPCEAPFEKAHGLSEGELIGKLAYTLGAETSEFTELFVTGALSGVLVLGKESVVLRKSLVPYVLTEQAVEAGYMPPDGVSALPPSLEWDVPPELRYWKAACGQDPRAVRDFLVSQALFTADSVRLVDELPRCTYEKRFVVSGYDAAPSVFAEVVPEALPEAAFLRAYVDRPLALAIEQAELMKVAGEVGSEVLAHFTDEDEPARTACVIETYKGTILSSDLFLLSAPDARETRQVLKQFGRPFALPGAAGRVLVASHPLPSEVVYLDDVVVAPEVDPVGKVALVKQTASDEEQYVLGIVLEPDVVDAQQDTYSEDEVRKTAHHFMARYQHAGLMHKTLINDQVRIVESYLAPAPCEIGGQPVKKGTWLMAMVVTDSALWAAVKDGTLTGFSIGGSAIRTPEG